MKWLKWRGIMKSGWLWWGCLLICVENSLSLLRTCRGRLSSFANCLRCPVETYDERLTSAAANKSMQSGGLGREDRKDKVDKVAAAMLLQSYLDKIRFAHGSSEE